MSLKFRSQQVLSAFSLDIYLWANFSQKLSKFLGLKNCRVKKEAN